MKSKEQKRAEAVSRNEVRIGFWKTLQKAGWKKFTAGREVNSLFSSRDIEKFASGVSVETLCTSKISRLERDVGLARAKGGGGIYGSD